MTNQFHIFELLNYTKSQQSTYCKWQR